MECGGLSVTDMTSGTPWMPLWCAGSYATSMRVRTLNAQTLYLLTASGLLYYFLVYFLVPSYLIVAFSTVLQALISLGRGHWERGYCKVSKQRLLHIVKSA